MFFFLGSTLPLVESSMRIGLLTGDFVAKTIDVRQQAARSDRKISRVPSHLGM